MKTLLKISMIAVLFTIISCEQDSELFINPTPDTIESPNDAFTVDIIDPFTGKTQGKSMLRRDDTGITVNFRATDLTEDYAYTLWWVIWNKPQNCQTPNACGEIDFTTPDMPEVEVLYATGHLVGPSGNGNFTARLNEDDVSGSINTLFDLPEYGGMKNAETAEVHLVLRSHGPALPGRIADQIGSYDGGCLYDLGAFTGDIPDAEGECGDILASAHQIQ